MFIMKRNRPYKQGMVNTDSNELFIKGQILEIIEEHDEYYLVRVYLTGKIEKIKKEEISIN